MPCDSASPGVVTRCCSTCRPDHRVGSGARVRRCLVEAHPRAMKWPCEVSSHTAAATNPDLHSGSATMESTVSIGSFGSFLIVLFARFRAIAVCGSVVKRCTSPGSPEPGISWPDSLPVQAALRSLSFRAEQVQNSAQFDMNPLQSKVPGFIIVRPFLNGIKSFGTADFLRADGPIAASVRRRKVSLAHALSEYIPALKPSLLASRSGLCAFGLQFLPRCPGVSLPWRPPGAPVRGPPPFLKIEPIFHLRKEA